MGLGRFTTKLHGNEGHGRPKIVIILYFSRNLGLLDLIESLVIQWIVFISAILFQRVVPLVMLRIIDKILVIILKIDMVGRDSFLER